VPRHRLLPAVPLVVWLGYFAALQWSVVRYRLSIVLALTCAAVLLAAALARRRQPTPPTPRQLALTLLGVAAVTELVPFFSHASPDDRRLLAHAMAGTAVLAAGCLVGLRRYALPAAAAVAVAGVVVWTTLSIRFSPTPQIDVWVILQQATDGLAHGINPYTTTWRGSPGVKDAFTYLPWTAVLLAPGRWLAGDVRWALLAALLVGFGCLAALSRGRTSVGTAGLGTAGLGTAGLGALVLLALAPGSTTQAEQAWTEPLLFACLAGWALLVGRGRPWWAILPLALGCASKQHLALLLPVLACWPGFGWRRTLATGGLAGALVAPWFAVGPADFWNDTVAFLVTFHPIRFADTWFIAAQTELGRTPPFWLTGLVVLATLLTACRAVLRRPTGLGELLGWLALVLLVANLVNKQAFYNQFWLVGALVALAVAALEGSRPDPQLNPVRD
jgi:hypothetical protein